MTRQPYWALTADLIRRIGQLEEAANACSRVIGLCEDAAARKFLTRKAGQEAE